MTAERALKMLEGSKIERFEPLPDNRVRLHIAEANIQFFLEFSVEKSKGFDVKTPLVEEQSLVHE